MSGLDTHTHRHTHRTTTVTLAAHARRGLIKPSMVDKDVHKDREDWRVCVILLDQYSVATSRWLCVKKMAALMRNVNAPAQGLLVRH